MHPLFIFPNTSPYVAPLPLPPPRFCIICAICAYQLSFFVCEVAHLQGRCGQLTDANTTSIVITLALTVYFLQIHTLMLLSIPSLPSFLHNLCLYIDHLQVVDTCQMPGCSCAHRLYFANARPYVAPHSLPFPPSFPPSLPSFLHNLCLYSVFFGPKNEKKSSTKNKAYYLHH